MTHRLFSSLFLLLFTSSLLLPASRAPIRARHGMVVASDQLAAEAGVSMLKQGGNAVDAAVATGFALAVTYPGAGNIGGGGFMVIRMADGKSLAIDYRETAPAAARRDMYLDANGTVKSSKITYGHLAAGVPGSVAGLLLALEKFGTMDRARVLQPAIDLAEKGFALDYRLAYSLEESLKNFSSFPGSMKSFSKNGVPYAEGELFRQPELAATLRLIADKGGDGFYRGRTADLIVAEMRRGRGIITHEDLEKYTPVFREPVHGTYKGYDIISMPPPSSGGVALIELLNILEGYPLHQYGWNSSRYAHCLTEAERRVYADRAEFLGDPDFVSIPTARLISKEYAAEQRALIDTIRASISDSVKHGSMPGYESPQTTHYSVADSAGNCVSVTTTLNSSYGCKLVVEGAGFLLNNEMDDFSAKPGVPNIYGLVGSTANAIMPGKRMLSSMTPTIVLKDGRPWLIVGSPGGSQIITTVLQTVLNMIDFRMDVQEAVDAPRFHHQWLPDKITFERRAFQTDVVEHLSSLGHRLDETGPNMGSVQAIFFDEKRGLLLGASDPRGYGEAVGY